MAKYIDTEKLIAEVERRMGKHWKGLPDADSPEDDWTHNELCELGAYKELEYIEDFLNSLLQEQQMPDSTQLIAEWENTKSMLEGKDFRNDSWRLAYNAFLEGFAAGCVRKEQKPEVKLTGWVARDIQHDPFLGLGLVLFEEKPGRSCGCWSGEIAAQLPWELFPDLKWEDEPVEVEVTIRKK